ncbi:hypothetical protein J4Q44_G00015270, partial [Coregonus suidteri]
CGLFQFSLIHEILKRFSGTFVYLSASSSVSSAHKPKVVPENCVLRHICAHMYSKSLLSLSLSFCSACTMCLLLDVTQMARGGSSLIELQFLGGWHTWGKMAPHSFLKNSCFQTRDFVANLRTERRPPRGG